MSVSNAELSILRSRFLAKPFAEGEEDVWLGNGGSATRISGIYVDWQTLQPLSERIAFIQSESTMKIIIFGVL